MDAKHQLQKSVRELWSLSRKVQLDRSINDDVMSGSSQEARVSEQLLSCVCMEKYSWAIPPTNSTFFFLKRGYVSSFQQAARLLKPHRDKKPLLNPFLLWLTLAMCVPPDFLIPLPVRARSTELNGCIIQIQGHPDFLLKKIIILSSFSREKNVQTIVLYKPVLSPWYTPGASERHGEKHCH